MGDMADYVNEGVVLPSAFSGVGPCAPRPKKTCMHCNERGLHWVKRKVDGQEKWRLADSSGALHRCSVKPLAEHVPAVLSRPESDDD